MNIVRKTFLKVVCPHNEKTFVRNIYGDEMTVANGGSIWQCKGCGNFVVENARYEETQSSTLNDAYFDRNQAALGFARLASEAGYNYGVDSLQDPEWPILYIDLPTGQVSWHIPAKELTGKWPTYNKKWDGHTLKEKRERLSKFIEYFNL